MANSRRARARKPIVPPRYVPIPRCQRSDGWTPDRQVAFIETLAQSGCVTEACKAVGRSRQSAYRLRNDPDATSFRIAWEHALDVAVRRIADNAYSRALHGVATPVFYKGEQIGEHVRHDERLVMFLLRYRDALYYGRANDMGLPEGDIEGAPFALRRSLDTLQNDASDAQIALENEEDRMIAIEHSERAKSDAGNGDPEPPTADSEGDVV